MTDEVETALRNIPTPMRAHLRAGRFAAARQAMRAEIVACLPTTTEREIAWADFQWVLRVVYHAPEETMAERPSPEPAPEPEPVPEPAA